jgi:Zn-dependent protease
MNQSLGPTCSGRKSMSSGSGGRIILAILAGYIANAVLIVATEQLFSLLVPGFDAGPPLYYFVVDLISQCFYTVAGGYLCCVIARPSQRVAMAGLIGIGVSVGTVFLITSWKTEPHWYGIALLVVYPLCVWLGWTLKSRMFSPPADG